ncbi:uncharacterized protein LOC142907771 isoform X2 [Petromyzon marinus]|uniref:uncharacterized protein LOC142907771 isoform X2 n=1 Tax=Petromyzon marinus TaxID=7757 RepID=UPI003F711DD6
MRNALSSSDVVSRTSRLPRRYIHFLIWRGERASVCLCVCRLYGLVSVQRETDRDSQRDEAIDAMVEDVWAQQGTSVLLKCAQGLVQYAKYNELNWSKATGDGTGETILVKRLSDGGGVGVQYNPAYGPRFRLAPDNSLEIAGAGFGDAGSYLCHLYPGIGEVVHVERTRLVVVRVTERITDLAVQAKRFTHAAPESQTSRGGDDGFDVGGLGDGGDGGDGDGDHGSGGFDCFSMEAIACYAILAVAGLMLAVFVVGARGYKSEELATISKESARANVSRAGRGVRSTKECPAMQFC